MARRVVACEYQAQVPRYNCAAICWLSLGVTGSLHLAFQIKMRSIFALRSVARLRTQLNVIGPNLPKKFHRRSSQEICAHGQFSLLEFPQERSDHLQFTVFHQH